MKLTILMYHYVRKIKQSRYPQIKGIELSAFCEQIDYLSRFYEFVSAEQIIAACDGRSILPNNAVVLTFDDGLLDHYTYVMPILDRLGIRGMFFPPAKAICERKVLDVHKIHFILAMSKNEGVLLQRVFDLIEDARRFESIETSAQLFEKLAQPSRYDSREIIFVKRLLQTYLPEPIRAQMVNALFEEYVGVDETVFANELYMTEEHLLHMRRRGMLIGSHGYNHCWLNNTNRAEQQNDIGKSIEMLDRLGVKKSERVICYPYGGFNADTLRIAEEFGFQLGLTTKVDLADAVAGNRLTLQRLDTNDFPVDGKAPPNRWTMQVVDHCSPAVCDA